MRKIALLAFTTLTLGACTVGPDYQKPQVNAPQGFVAQDVLSALNELHENEPFPAEWWMGFDDQLLNELVETALEQNFEIAAALARVKEANARVGLADSADNLFASGSVEGDVQERRELDGDDGSTTTTSRYS